MKLFVTSSNFLIGIDEMHFAVSKRSIPVYRLIPRRKEIEQYFATIVSQRWSVLYATLRRLSIFYQIWIPRPVKRFLNRPWPAWRSLRAISLADPPRRSQTSGFFHLNGTTSAACGLIDMYAVS